MGVTFGGFASGLDTNAIIDAFVKAERQPIDALLTKQKEIDSAATIVTSISTKITTLRDAAAALSDPSKFASMSATSSDTSVVASTTTGAAAGRYDVQVTQLAKEQRTYSDVQTSGTAALSMAGTLSLQVGTGTTADISIDATDSLSSIAAKINTSGTRVSASVLYDGTNYRLALRGLDTGADNAITIGQNGFDLGLNKAANKLQSAQDAQLTVDGIAVHRSTNQVVGVIQGVTLALTKTTTTPTTLTVASDGTALKQRITTFVNAYNDVVRSGQQATGYGQAKATNDTLSGDSSIRGVMGRLSRIVGSEVTGTSGKYTTLMSVGISSTRDGLLQFNDSAFTTALSNDSTSVARLFTKDANLGSTGAFDTFKTTADLVNGTTKSPLRARIESLQKQSVRITETTDAMERRITDYETSLRKQFSDMETIVSKYKSAGNAISSGSGGNSG